MALYASWSHGNALTVETPENFKSIRHMGWGTDLEFIPDRQSWFHVPIATPVIVDGRRAKVKNFYLLFDSDQAFLRDVHIFDGPNLVERFHPAATPWGPHGGGIDKDNTFTLAAAHPVSWGMGISFRMTASDAIEVPVRPTLRVVTAGADFTA